MAKNNTLLYAALGVGAVYLLAKRKQAALPVSTVPYPVATTPISQVSQVGVLLPILQKFLPGLISPSTPATPVTPTDFSTPGTAENIADTDEAAYWSSQSPTAQTAAPSSGAGNLVTSASSSPTGIDINEDDPFGDLSFL